MARLIVNPGTENAWDIPLSPQTISLGRGRQNDFPIEHPSVSDTHCRITVMNSGVLVKDEGSINGTFIDGKMVDEALLLPGQTLRLGDVAMQLDSVPAASAGLPVANQAEAGTAAPCQTHPKAIGHFYCARCKAHFCDLCVTTRMTDGAPAKFCRVCGSECVNVQPESVHESVPFSRVVGGAFTYPFKHDGLILLVAGTIFYLIVDFLANHIPFLGIIVAVFGTGYLFNYMQRILTVSATGDDKMPDWPEFSDWSDVVDPLIQMLGTVAVSFGPAILIMKLHPAGAGWVHWALPTALFWGCLSFPMSFTAVTMFDSLNGLNPLLIIPSMLRIPGTYLLAVAVLATIVVANTIGTLFLGTVLPIPFLSDVISEFIGLYLLTVEMRILGLMYWTKKEKLGWFRH